MVEGYLNLVLHAHLPFVRHLDRDDRLEERWLFEALCESYIPLLQVFYDLARDGVDFRVTISLSPTLISMLADPLLQNRFQIYIEKQIQLAKSEMVRTADHPQLNELARQYLERFRSIREFYLSYDRNLLDAFSQLQQAGKLELITSAATHAFLPYVQSDEALCAQIETAVTLFKKHFGKAPAGIWLPECAYTPRIDPFLKRSGIRYFFVDAHGLTTAKPEPVFGTFSPVLTPNCIAAFSRDDEASEQVWSSELGYPGDYDYREYYRDIGFDLEESYIGPYIHQDGIRVNTGIKYYRITGGEGPKALYDPARAREKAAIHAGNFLFNRQNQIQHAHSVMGRLPIVTAPYDAELFGHWWYEGPIFIDMLLRKMHFDQSVVKCITPSEYLALYPDFQSCELAMTTWGRHGYGDVWLNGSNDWIYPALHDCERTMIEFAGKHRDPASLTRRVLNQMARELMLAESSDFAFMMDAKTTVDYAVTRTKHHVNRFRTLAAMLRNGQVDEVYLDEIEQLDNLFPDIDYEVYRTCERAHSIPPAAQLQKKPCVLMLSWEFPPMIVGGLSRHVYDLSRYLVKEGCDVHVVTTAVGDYPLYETIEGVHVHRVRVQQPDGGEFFHFAFQLNLAMIDHCRELFDRGFTFDLIHAHDWLVCEAAKTLKHTYGIALISTIHATEHGRNSGIHTELQRQIHDKEWQLTYESKRVLVCSTYMKNEVTNLFSLPTDKIHVLPNGIDSHQLQAASRTDLSSGVFFADDFHNMVLFIGRLVREKGVHLLIDASDEILAEFPKTKFVIVGKGPLQDELMVQVDRLGISHQVTFAGFVPDETRNGLLRMADVAVFPSLYEPFGIVALEAMAAGTPIVAADVGGLGDIVKHNHTGLKMLPGDAHSLAVQTNRLLRDREFARQLTSDAKAELARFAWEEIAAQTKQIYEQLIHSGINILSM